MFSFLKNGSAYEAKKKDLDEEIEIARATVAEMELALQDRALAVVGGDTGPLEVNKHDLDRAHEHLGSLLAAREALIRQKDEVIAEEKRQKAVMDNIRATIKRREQSAAELQKAIAELGSCYERFMADSQALFSNTPSSARITAQCSLNFSKEMPGRALRDAGYPHADPTHRGLQTSLSDYAKRQHAELLGTINE